MSTSRGWEGKWAGTAHSDCGWTCWVCYTWALLRWRFTSRRHHIKCTYLYLYASPMAEETRNWILSIECGICSGIIRWNAAYVIEFRRLSLRVLPQLPGNCTYMWNALPASVIQSLGHSPPSKKASVITTATWPYRPPVRDTRPSRTALYWNMKLHVGLIMQRNLQEILR